MISKYNKKVKSIYQIQGIYQIPCFKMTIQRPLAKLLIDANSTFTTAISLRDEILKEYPTEL